MLRRSHDHHRGLRSAVQRPDIGRQLQPPSSGSTPHDRDLNPANLLVAARWLSTGHGRARSDFQLASQIVRQFIDVRRAPMARFISRFTVGPLAGSARPQSHSLTRGAQIPIALAAPLYVPYARFPSLEAFGRRPPNAPRRPSSGRHPKPLYEREVVKAFPHGFDRRSYPFVWPLQSPSFRPDPQYLNALARRAGQGWPPRCPCHARRISRPLLDRSEHDGRLRRVGNALAARRALSSRNRAHAVIRRAPDRYQTPLDFRDSPLCEACSAGPAPMSMARATIASPYIRQLRYGLPLCCMHGRSREKDGAHLHNGRLARPNLRWVSPATHPTRPTLHPKERRKR